MNKILKAIKFFIEFLINLAIFVALAIVVLWLFWDVSPQTSVTKTAYFFSESWRILSGKQKSTEEFTQVGRQQLTESQKHIRTLDAK